MIEGSCDAKGAAESGSAAAPPRTVAGRLAVLLGAWVVLTGLLIALGFLVVHSSAIQGFDRHVTSTVAAHRTPALNRAMKAVTWLGSWVVLIAAVVVVLVLAARRRLPWLAVLVAAAAWAGEAIGVTVVKHVVQRPRPPRELWVVNAHGWSWPSGHTATAVVAFGVVAAALTHIIRSRWVRTTIWAIASIAVVAVGFSRVELGVHWVTDVLASVAFVFAWLLVGAMLFGGNLKATTADLPA